MKNLILTALVYFLALYTLAAAFGCDKDDSSADSDADTDTDTDTDTDADSDTDTDTDQGCDSSLLPGVWLSTDYSVHFFDDLSYEAAGAPNLMEIDVTGQAAVDGCEISFTDIDGEYACPSDQVGIYTFEVDATTLSFELVSDECDGRRIPLDGATLTQE